MDARTKKLHRIAIAQALSMTADTIEQYLTFFAQETGLRAELEPLTTAEQFEIAREATRTILEYEA